VRAMGGMERQQGAILPEKKLAKEHHVMTTNIKIIFFIFVWYFVSSLSNNTNKMILSIMPRPMLLTLAQLMFVFIFSAIYLFFQGKFALFSRPMMIRILPLAFANFFTHFLAYVALKDIAVSFINTIKATSPIFTVVLSYFFFSKRYSTSILITLVPVVFGVSLCTFSELESLWGIVVTLFSTFILVTQNLYSKEIFKHQKVHEIVLVMNVAGLAFFANLPLYVYFDLLSISAPGAMFDNMSESGTIFMYFILNGFFHFVQNAMAFTILSLVSPVTYSVANTLKRVFVIVLSIIWFRNPVSLTNALGIIIALTGIFLYNRACVIEREKQLKNTLHV